MSTQLAIQESLEAIIPADLWAKYSHLSFAEMAEIPELEEWAADLRQAEDDWFDADE